MSDENCYDVANVCHLFSSGRQQPQYPEELHLPLLFNDEVNPEEESRQQSDEPALNRDASSES